jgi:hypothetical protein
MADRAVKRATPRSWHCNGVKTHIGASRQDRPIVAQADEWERGTRWAGIALVLMFAFLTFGAVVLGW